MPMERANISDRRRLFEEFDDSSCDATEGSCDAGDAARTARISVHVNLTDHLHSLAKLFEVFTADRPAVVISAKPTIYHAIISGRANTFETAEAKFNSLLSVWRQDVAPISNQVTVLMHPAHYAIIGMGRDALPFIFKDLANGGGPWFVALQAIT